MFFYYDFKHYFSKRSFPPINETQIYVQFPYDSSLFFFLFRQYIQEGDAWELSTVNDVRPGTSPQEPRNHQLLVKKHGENVYEKSIVVCSGVDMVNIQYMNIIFKDAPTAEVRITKLFRIQNIMLEEMALERHFKICHFFGIRKAMQFILFFYLNSK